MVCSARVLRCRVIVDLRRVYRRHVITGGSRLAQLITAACVAIAATTCGRSTPSSPSASASIATTLPPSTRPGSVAGCEVTGSTSGAPLIADPKSPYYDHLGLASTADGRSAVGYREVLPHASAPDGTPLPDGSVGVYYNNGETGGSVWLARVAGARLAPASPISLNGVANALLVADVAVSLVDGKVRVYYLHGAGGTRRFCVAESSDGVSFQVIALATRFSGTEADPTVVRLENGSWLMAFSRENHTSIGFARSNDGLTFTPFATAAYGVVPELAITDDGRVRLYVCASGNVESYTSADAGTTWTREGIVIRNSDVGRRIVCDPTFIGATRTFVFKVTDA